jgi:phosphatidylglycerol:prolipoprotein diacylglycerol transferase
MPVFGIVVATAIMLSAWIARKEVRRYEVLGRLPHSTHTLITDLVFVSVIVGLVGARLFHILDYPDQFMDDPASMIFSRAGFSIYGGLTFGIASGVVFLMRRSTPILPMLDATAPSMMLGYAIGRLGCQVSGDGDWGVAANMALKPTWLQDWFWSQTYDGNIVGVVIPTPGVYPTPLYEAAAGLVLFGVLWALRSHKHHAGCLFSVYLLLAGFERLLIEKIRINVHLNIFGITLTQAEAISYLLILAGLGGVLAALRSRGFLVKAVFSISVLAALSACVPL